MPAEEIVDTLPGRVGIHLDEANAAMPNAMKRIDKAAKANIIHDNAAARYKSRLARNAAAKG